MSQSTTWSAKRRRTCTHHIKGTIMKTLRKKRTSTRTMAMIAGSLLAVSLVGSTPAYAGPAAMTRTVFPTINSINCDLYRLGFGQSGEVVGGPHIEFADVLARITELARLPQLAAKTRVTY